MIGLKLNNKYNFAACVCTPTSVTPNTPPCPDCLHANIANFVGEDSAGPCGKVMVIDLKALNLHLESVLVDYKLYKVAAGDEVAFNSVYMDSESRVIIQTSTNAIEHQCYRIYYTVEDVAKRYIALGWLDIYIRDLCMNKVGDCNRCTGDSSVVTDLVLGNNSGDIRLT